MVVPRVVAALIAASCILHVAYASFEVELAGLKVGVFFEELMMPAQATPTQLSACLRSTQHANCVVTAAGCAPDNQQGQVCTVPAYN